MQDTKDRLVIGSWNNAFIKLHGIEIDTSCR